MPEWNLNVTAGEAAVTEINTTTEVMDDVNPEAEVSMEEVFITAPSYWGWEGTCSLNFWYFISVRVIDVSF